MHTGGMVSARLRPRLLRAQEHQALQYQYAGPKLLLLASCYQEGSLSPTRAVILPTGQAIQLPSPVYGR